MRLGVVVMAKNKILLIIPAYNEEGSILKVINEIEKWNKKNKTQYDYVVINDGSTDRTEAILTENQINHITLLQNLGIGGSVQTGYKYAKDNDYSVAVQIDGDGQHDVNSVEKIVKPLLDNEADMVIGSRFVEDIDTFKSSRLRRVGIGIISFFIKFVTGKKIYDTTSGMRSANRKLICEFADDYPTEYPEPITATTILRKGYRVVERSVSMKEREEGTSSIRTWKNCYYMMNVVLSILVEGLRRSKK